MFKSVIFFFVLGWLGLSGMQLLQGASLASLFHPLSLSLVVGGTILALISSNGWGVVKDAFGWSFRSDGADPVAKRIPALVEIATVARKDGFLALEAFRSKDDPFLSQALRYLMDGVDPVRAEEFMRAETDRIAERLAQRTQVIEQGVQAAPLFGIIGAILGLVQALAHLDQPQLLGQGVSEALVSTLYGFLLSALFFGPLTERARAKSVRDLLPYRLTAIGIGGVFEGVAAPLIEERLKKEA